MFGYFRNFRNLGDLRNSEILFCSPILEIVEILEMLEVLDLLELLGVFGILESLEILIVFFSFVDAALLFKYKITIII